MRVLLVEDDKEFGEFMHEYLTSEGHEVTFLVRGTDAMRMINFESFDAVVSDFELGWNQPEGIDILLYVQAISPETMTILFSGLDRTRECEQADVEFDHVLVKNNIAGLGEILASV